MEVQYLNTVSTPTNTITATIDEKQEITIEISPTSNKKDIEKIVGQFGDHNCQFNKEEIDRLVNYIKGIKGSLTDKVSFHVKASMDPKGRFQLFVTGLATTMVQFKLLGQVFPGEALPFSPNMMDEKTFRRLAKFKTNNTLLKNWISKMISFWNNWSFMFDYDKDSKKEIKQLQKDMEAMRQEIIELKRQIYILKCYQIKFI